MPLIPAVSRQRQVILCEFEASLFYESYFQHRLQSYCETLIQKSNKQQTNKQKALSPLQKSVNQARRIELRGFY